MLQPEACLIAVNIESNNSNWLYFHDIYNYIAINLPSVVTVGTVGTVASVVSTIKAVIKTKDQSRSDASNHKGRYDGSNTQICSNNSLPSCHLDCSICSTLFALHALIKNYVYRNHT